MLQQVIASVLLFLGAALIFRSLLKFLPAWRAKRRDRKDDQGENP